MIEDAGWSHPKDVTRPHLGELLEFRLQMIKSGYKEILMALSVMENEEGDLYVFEWGKAPYLYHEEVVGLENGLRNLVQEAQNLADLVGIDLEA